MNSLRCMLNSGASSLWALGAGTWLLLKYSGLEGDLRPMLDTGYEYVCTCIYDLNGAKSMLGQSDESNSAFSYCSEAGYAERIKARERKAQLEADKQDAARVALLEAAEREKINAAAEVVEGLDGCALRSSSAVDNEKCFAAAQAAHQQAVAIHRFWATSVELSGGEESTMNKVEQTNLKEATWTLTGTRNGLKNLYADRFNDDGTLVESCAGSAGTVWGAEACESVIAEWVAANSTPVAPCKGDACDTIQCYAGNDAAATSQTTAELCDLVELEYGYSQWQDKASITCTDASFNGLSGYANCQQVDGAWKARKDYTNPDQPRFRTIGETVGTNVRDADVQCLAADFTTVRTGADNCWSYWLEGSTQEIGINLDGTPVREDSFIWLTNEGVSCGLDTNGVELTGVDNCTIDQRIPCSTTKLARLNIDANSSSICLPTLTWKKRT